MLRYGKSGTPVWLPVVALPGRTHVVISSPKRVSGKTAFWMNQWRMELNSIETPQYLTSYFPWETDQAKCHKNWLIQSASSSQTRTHIVVPCPKPTTRNWMWRKHFSRCPASEGVYVPFFSLQNKKWSFQRFPYKRTNYPEYISCFPAAYFPEKF